MANHPINLLLRFILELAAWLALGYWSWVAHQGSMRWLLVLGLPLTTIVIWGVFRVPENPHEALVAVSGIVRLILEGIILFGGALALYASDLKEWGIAFAVILVVHYAAAYDRVMWLIRGH